MFKGLGNLGNLAGMGNLVKQMQELQSRITEIEEELALQTVQGSAGGGMVTVIANGKQEIQSITIEPDLLIREELDMLQDMIVAATNQALEASRNLRAEKLSALTGGLKIPGLL